MSRALASISVVLGGGFSALAHTISNLTVYDGTGLAAVLPIILGVVVAASEYDVDDGDDLPDGLTDEEVRNLGGEADA
jgi:hypothetical protein